MANFSFTRNPSIKVAVDIEAQGLIAADNTLVLIGRMAASGSTATALAPIKIDNYGDPVAAKTETDTKFGAGSELGAMVIAAIKGVFYSDLDPKLFPPIVCIPMANASTDLAGALAANLTLPMPFAAVYAPASDATALAAFKSHLSAISASDRGANSQFGSFGFMASDQDTSAATTIGNAAQSQNICFPWLRDLAGAKANKTYEVAAAIAAVCASNGVPFMPLNGVRVGGLVAPSQAADYHTSGDAGTVALGLAAGLIPLTIAPDQSVRISRTVTASQRVAGTPDASYYDLQDWQVLYYFRKNAFNLFSQPRYRIAKATDAKLKAGKSELIGVAKNFETLSMFQKVDQLANLFTITRQLGNRNAVVYSCPNNVVPGLMNIGVGEVGTTQFDSFQIG